MRNEGDFARVRIRAAKWRDKRSPLGRRHAFSLIVALGVHAGAIGPAKAEVASVSELQTARELFAEAESDERAGSWPIALEKMRRVGQIKMTPGIRVHIAVCEEHLGHLVAALGEYALADAQAQVEGNREVQRLMKEPLEALQARVPRVVIRVPPDVKGLRVSLDGKPLVAGVLGMAMPIDASVHHIEAGAPGFLPFRVSFVGKERDRAEIAVQLEGEPARDTRTVQKSVGPNRTPAIAVTAGALLLTGAGIGAFLVAGGKQSDAREACARGLACDDLKSGVRTWDAIALASWIGAGAAAAAAVVLWTSTGPENKAASALVIGPGSARFEGTF